MKLHLEKLGYHQSAELVAKLAQQLYCICGPFMLIAYVFFSLSEEPSRQTHTHIYTHHQLMFFV